MQKNIMRRVYLSYVLSRATHPLTIRIVVALSLGMILTRFVSFRAVLSNLMNVEVGQVGQFVVSAVAHTEVWTLILVGTIIFLLLSYRPAVRTTHTMVHST